jgi:hypothetical protein
MQYIATRVTTVRIELSVCSDFLGATVDSATVTVSNNSLLLEKFGVLCDVTCCGLGANSSSFTFFNISFSEFHIFQVSLYLTLSHFGRTRT